MSLSSNIPFHKSKNRILYCVLFFIISSISLTAQNFQLASNNKTVTCDGVSFGQTGVVGGKTYTKVTRNTLVSMISGGQDVSCVCTSGITNMQGLFQNNQTFNQDISSWDTSNVNNMQGLFQNARAFNQDIGYWDVSSMNDQNGVNQLFDNATNLNQDLSYWCFPNNYNIYQNRQNIWGNNNPIRNNASLQPRFSGRSPQRTYGGQTISAGQCRSAKTAAPPLTQTKLGADIDGEAADDRSGIISLSSDGTRVAVGAYTNDGANGADSGHVRIYEYSGGSWSQLGADIDGEAANDRSGYSVSLSSDGSRVAIGAPKNDGVNGSLSGHVRVYEYSSGSWTQLGADIDGEAQGDEFGWSVSLSSDGSRVAIGAYGNDGNGTNSGHVRIYEYSNGSWTQVGSDIDGEASNDFSGRSVSISSDGSTVAIGADGNDGNGTNSGHVRIYEYSNGSWTQVGSDIDGEASNDFSGRSVSISSDGSTVAIGANGNDGNGSISGHTRIYEYSGGSWSQLGSDINGEAAYDESGWSVSLSSDGSRVAIGAPENDGNGTNMSFGTNVYNIGHTRIYEYSGGSWSQLGAEIDGEAQSDKSGYSVSLSSDGTRVAIGAILNDGIGVSSGHVRVYSLGPTSSPATLTITSNDSDNVITSGQVTLTATFSENMTASPTISISGVVTNVAMTQSTTAAVWTYYWQVPSNISSGTTLNVTSTATSTNNIAYSGNASLTLTISPTFYLASNGVTIKCSGCNAGDTGMVSGTLYTAVENGSGTNGIQTLVNAGNYNLVTTLVTNMSGLFDGNTSFNTDIGFWDTSNVTTMYEMFKGATSFNQNIGAWDTSSNTNMNSMFSTAQAFNNGGSNTINNWDTSSNTNMNRMFNNANSFNQNIGNWNTSNVTTMGNAFQGANAFNQNIGAWNTSKVTNMSYMFSSNSGFNNGGSGSIGNWDTSKVTTMASIFNDADAFNQNIGAWNTSKVTNMSSMFSGNSGFNNGGSNTINNWDTSSVTTMNQMFYQADAFNQNIGNWNTSNVGNMLGMFQYNDNFNQDLSGWCVSRLSSEPNNFKDGANSTWRNDASKQPEWGVCNSNVSVILSDTDEDNLLAASDTVTITAVFSEAMTATPTISITGVVTNVAMLGGTASFTASDIATSADGARSVYAADMDGDGDMDIVSASQQDNTIAWYENNGAVDPTWTASDIATNADFARSVFAADMDGDGDMDIISASLNDNTIAWYENNGAADPSFTASDIATSANGAFSVFAADMDGDGDMDIVSASVDDDTIAWYENNGAADPSWTAADIATSADGARSVFAADMDGDGDMDIVSASTLDNTIAWYENNGAADPSWTKAVIATSADLAKSVFAADMDGDGDMDIVSASSGDNTIAWYENNGAADPSWTAADIATNANAAFSVYAADMDGDGDIDIVSASSGDDTIAWYENNGAADPTWTATDIATSADGARSVFAADMDGDGDMDIVSASQQDNTIAWYENTGFSYNYTWDVDSGGAPSDGTYRATVSGTASATGGAYSGTDSITFTLDTSAPTATLSSTDSDNLVSTSQVVTITAGFSEAMTATPTISITGIVTNVIMTPVSGTNSYTYRWDTSSGTLTTWKLCSYSKRYRPYRKPLCSRYTKYHL